MSCFQGQNVQGVQGVPTTGSPQALSTSGKFYGGPAGSTGNLTTATAANEVQGGGPGAVVTPPAAPGGPTNPLERAANSSQPRTPGTYPIGDPSQGIRMIVPGKRVNMSPWQIGRAHV